MREKVEALLFAAGRFLDEEQMAKLLQQDLRSVRKALTELKARYESLQTSLQVVQEGNSWKLHVKDDYLELVSKLVSDKEIATTVLESLAIIAWRNPAMQAELIKIRGPAAYEHVGELIERGFITKEPEGRTFKLRVTDKFYEYFDVEGQEDLRAMFSDVGERAAEDQAAIDRQQQAYEAQKRVVEEAREALEMGEDVQTPKLENSLPTTTAHSAKDHLAAMILEIKSEADKMGVEKPEAPVKLMHEDAVASLREDVQAFGEDVEKLRDEMQEGDVVPLHRHKHAKPVKHARKNKPAVSQHAHHMHKTK